MTKAPLWPALVGCGDKRHYLPSNFEGLTLCGAWARPYHPTGVDIICGSCKRVAKARGLL